MEHSYIFFFFPPKKITCKILSLFGIILKNSNMFFYPVLPWHKTVKNKNHNLITVICLMRNWSHARTYKISFAYADSTAAKVVSSVGEVLSRSRGCKSRDHLIKNHLRPFTQSWNLVTRLSNKSMLFHLS